MKAPLRAVFLVACFTASANPVVRAQEVPERVVSLAPSLTAMVVALGAQEKLAGVTPFCDAPDAIPRVSGGMQPDPEAVLGLAPELVLSTSMTPETTRRQMADLGLRVEVIDTGSLSSIAAAMSRLAEIFGLPGPTLTQPRHRDSRGTALLLFGAETSFSAGRGTHAHEILEAAGLRNIASESAGPWPQLGEEFILENDPDVVVVADYGNGSRGEALAMLRAHPVRSHLRAVRDGKVVVVPAKILTVPGPDALGAAAKLQAEVEKL